MSLWGNLDAANNAPKQAAMTGYGGTTGSVSSNGQTYYANTQINATVQNNALGIFGVDTTEQSAATAAQGVPQHAGWNVRKVGMGPIVSVTANNGAVGANATLTLSGGNGIGATTGSTPATVVVRVNTANYIIGVDVTNGGLYANTPVANTMSNAVFTITMGGRANRVQTETLVAMGSMTGDGGSVY